MGISGEKKKIGRRNKHSEILVITVEEVWTGGRTLGTKQGVGVRESRLRVRKREVHTDGDQDSWETEAQGPWKPSQTMLLGTGKIKRKD